MATSASARHHLFRTLERVLGDEDAATLMDHLPEGGWEEVATKSDLRALGSELRGEMVALHSVLKTEIAELRSQVVTEQDLASIIDLHIDARMGAIARQWTMANVAMSATMLAAVIAAIRL